MEDTTLNMQQADAAPARKPWHEPAILLERLLEVAAQDGAPSEFGAQPSFLGPLNGSGMPGGCT
jgi:hypothetical protein